jgi:hypothetical protein
VIKHRCTELRQPYWRTIMKALPGIHNLHLVLDLPRMQPSEPLTLVYTSTGLISSLDHSNVISI